MFCFIFYVCIELVVCYVNCLCKYWGYKFEVEFIFECGFIDFGDFNCELFVYFDYVLMIFNSFDEDSFVYMQNVVVDYL